MGKQWCYFLFLLWFCYLIISSILLFTKGFLLSRVTQKANSTCLSLNEIPCTIKNSLQDKKCTDNDKISFIFNNINSASGICLPQQSRVILMIVDALRYDFTIYDHTNTNPTHFQNKLPFINELINNYPDNTRLYKFIADPPTTTMQRIKALTTGSLPTFIDAGSNFATNEINEDNLIDQLIKHNRSIVFMGDDTWNGLYPNRFTRNYPFPSFNVWDLDTVDNGIVNQIYDEIKLNDWSLLIAHFLGVDHCGHRYGPYHPEMSRKLGEINNIIKNITNEMDENTTLIVIGDHGMTTTGDHGGETDNELTAAFFLYSKENLSSYDDNNTINEVKQVDLVPTLAGILGISSPFSNLGILIHNALPTNNFNEEWQYPLYLFWANAQQMIDYISEYSQNTNTFDKEILKIFKEKFSILNSRLLSIKTKDDFNQFINDLKIFLIKLRIMCEEVWIQFDSFSITRGLLFLFLSMFFIFIITDGIPINRLPEIFMSKFLFCSYLVMFIALLLSCLFYYLNIVDNLLLTIFFLTAIVSQFMLVMLIIQNWELISLNWYDRSKKEKIPNMICRLVLVFNLCGLFSNSFIIEESFVLLFLLNSTILINTLCLIRKKNQLKTKLKLILIGVCIMISVRLTKYFWRCRAEQQWCFATFHELNTITAKIETTKLQWALTIICLALFVTFTKVWLRNCGNLNGFSINVTFIKFIPTVLVVCTGGYWVLNRLPIDTNNKLITTNWQKDLLAWIVYGFSILGIISTILQPLYTFILSTNTTTETTNNDYLIPQLFKKVKCLFNNSDKTYKEQQIPVVCGLATVYSAVFLILGVYLTLAICLILSDAVAPSIIFLFFTAAFILIITSLIRLKKVETIEQLFEIPNTSLLIWVILTQYFFYASGHQACFPNIAWDAAFVGTSGVFTNNFIPGLLIIINTFSSHILIGLFLPLILIAPFTISVMIPSFLNKKNILLQENNLRGEILLYERDGLMITTVFTICCKYIMCHGLRVFASMLAATIHCRHLMVWNIFAPKLIFESIGMLITLISVTISFLILIRINYNVDKLIVSLNKKNS